MKTTVRIVLVLFIIGVVATEIEDNTGNPTESLNTNCDSLEDCTFSDPSTYETEITTGDSSDSTTDSDSTTEDCQSDNSCSSSSLGTTGEEDTAGTPPQSTTIEESTTITNELTSESSIETTEPSETAPSTSESITTELTIPTAGCDLDSTDFCDCFPDVSICSTTVAPSSTLEVTSPSTPPSTLETTTTTSATSTSTSIISSTETTTQPPAGPTIEDIQEQIIIVASVLGSVCLVLLISLAAFAVLFNSLNTAAAVFINTPLYIFDNSIQKIPRVPQPPAPVVQERRTFF